MTLTKEQFQQFKFIAAAENTIDVAEWNRRRRLKVWRQDRPRRLAHRFLMRLSANALVG